MNPWMLGIPYPTLFHNKQRNLSPFSIEHTELASPQTNHAHLLCMLHVTGGCYGRITTVGGCRGDEGRAYMPS